MDARTGQKALKYVSYAQAAKSGNASVSAIKKDQDQWSGHPAQHSRTTNAITPYPSLPVSEGTGSKDTNTSLQAMKYVSYAQAASSSKAAALTTKKNSNQGQAKATNFTWTTNPSPPFSPEARACASPAQLVSSYISSRKTSVSTANKDLEQKSGQANGSRTPRTPPPSPSPSLSNDGQYPEQDVVNRPSDSEGSNGSKDSPKTPQQAVSTAAIHEPRHGEHNISETTESSSSSTAAAAQSSLRDQRDIANTTATSPSSTHSTLVNQQSPPTRTYHPLIYHTYADLYNPQSPPPHAHDLDRPDVETYNQQAPPTYTPEYDHDHTYVDPYNAHIPQSYPQQIITTHPNDPSSQYHHSNTHLDHGSNTVNTQDLYFHPHPAPHQDFLAPFHPQPFPSHLEQHSRRQRKQRIEKKNQLLSFAPVTLIHSYKSGIIDLPTRPAPTIFHDDKRLLDFDPRERWTVGAAEKRERDWTRLEEAKEFSGREERLRERVRVKREEERVRRTEERVKREEERRKKLEGGEVVEGEEEEEDEEDGGDEGGENGPEAEVERGDVDDEDEGEEVARWVYERLGQDLWGWVWKGGAI